MTKKMNKAEWKAIETRLERATSAAEAIVKDVAAPPIDPLTIAAEERRFLRCMGEDFGLDFDGQLEYHPKQRLFLLFYNTRYDNPQAGDHHPRTRFSIAHELGHFFLEQHRAYYLRGGKPLPSHSEFATPVIMEREADAFASGLLLPSHLVRPLVNLGEPTAELIDDLASSFRTSRISTAIRTVQLSDFPCALVGLRDGVIAWSTRSSALIDANLYPPSRGSAPSAASKRQWELFIGSGQTARGGSALASEWFRTFDNDYLEHLSVEEHYLAVSVMDTLVVLLNVPEDELPGLDDDD